MSFFSSLPAFPPPLSVCFHGSLCLCHQRFEGFRNEKTMPQSLEPSCSTNSEDGPITVNHLRSVHGLFQAQFPAQGSVRRALTLAECVFSPHALQIDVWAFLGSPPGGVYLCRAGSSSSPRTSWRIGLIDGRLVRRQSASRGLCFPRFSSRSHPPRPVSHHLRFSPIVPGSFMRRSWSAGVSVYPGARGCVSLPRSFLAPTGIWERRRRIPRPQTSVQDCAEVLKHSVVAAPLRGPL